MTNLDVALRLRLLNMLSGPANQAERDLKGIERAARRLNGVRAGASIRDDLGRISNSARQADRALLGMASRVGGPIALGLAVKKSYQEFATFDDRLVTIGITAETSGQRLRKVGENAKVVGREMGTAATVVLGATEKLVAGGLDLGSAETITRDVAKTAKAYRAEMEDVASAGVAVMKNLKIEATGVGRAFDTMAKGGSVGMFELKDMAREVPSLAAAFNKLGAEGQDGVRDLVAFLEIHRDAAGNSAEAANDVLNLFQKMKANETIQSFKKLGVDSEAAFKKAEKEGRNVLDVVGELLMKATGGDAAKLAKLIPDMQANKAAWSLLQAIITGRLKTIRGELDKAGGTVDRALTQRLESAASKTERLSAAFNELLVSVGAFADSAGVTKLLEGVAYGAQRAADLISKPEERARASAQRVDTNKADVRQGELKGAEGRVAGYEAMIARDNGVNKERRAWMERSLGEARSEREQIRLQIEALKTPWPLEAPDDLRPPEKEPASEGSAVPRPMPNPLRGSLKLPAIQPLDGGATAEEARRAMEGVTSAIQSEGEKAVQESQSIADRIKAIFNFTATPTISPQFAPSGGGSAPGVPLPPARPKTSSAGGGRTFAQSNTFHVNTGDPHAAARDVERRLARLGNSNNALFDAVPT